MRKLQKKTLIQKHDCLKLLNCDKSEPAVPGLNAASLTERLSSFLLKKIIDDELKAAKEFLTKMNGFPLPSNIEQKIEIIKIELATIKDVGEALAYSSSNSSLMLFWCPTL